MRIKKFSLLLIVLWLIQNVNGQNLMWSTFIDSTLTYSSPRLVNLNGDSILDVLIGAGVEDTEADNGIVAINGLDGSVLWSRPSHDEIFNSAQFADFNGDGLNDVVVGGRHAQLYAISGIDGSLIWEFWNYPDSIEPADSGWYNFYSPQLIQSINGDTIMDVLIANGGDHAAQPWDTMRPPGHLLILNGANGAILSKAVVPDSAETYCSAVVLSVNGVLKVIFGTGGETLGGSSYVADLNDLINNNLSNAVPIASNLYTGFIAPPSVVDLNNDTHLDAVIQGFGGGIYAYDIFNDSVLWSTNVPGAESSAAPVIGNFTGNSTPDVFAVLNKGVNPSYFDHYQVLINGSTGMQVWKDSISSLHFASANAVDVNSDGRDEALISVNFHTGTHFEHQLMVLDFQNDSFYDYYGRDAGVNLASTPTIADMNNDDTLELVFAFRADSVNPMGPKGIYVKMLETNWVVPPVGVAWGAYMGTEHNGHYFYNGNNCGSISTTALKTQPSCNDSADGALDISVVGGQSPYLFLWDNGEVSEDLVGIGAGNYNLTVTDQNGCFGLGNYGLGDPYVITSGGIVNNTCSYNSSGQVTISSSGCPCMFSGCGYLWSNGDSIKTATGLSTGQHTVTITHLDGCVVVDTVEIGSNPPMIDSIFTKENSCWGVNDGVVELFPQDTNTIASWSDSFVGLSRLITPPGNYMVYIQDPIPCYDTLAFSLVFPDTVSQLVATIDESCYGAVDGQINASGSGGDIPYSISSNGIINPGTTVISLSAGSYQVFLQDSNGCHSDTSNVSINSPDSVSFSSSWIDASCYNENDGEINLTPTSGSSPFVYYANGVNLNGSTSSSLAPGNFECYIEDANGCSSDSLQINIFEPSEISSNTFSVPDSAGVLGWASVTASGGIPPYAYLWSDALSQSSDTAFGLTSGTYMVTITDANGCETTDSIDVDLFVGFKLMFNLKSIDVFPNPFSNYLEFHALDNSTIKSVNIELTDIKGDVVFSQRMMIPGRIFPNKLAQGVYYLKIQGAQINEYRQIMVAY